MKKAKKIGRNKIIKSNGYPISHRGIYNYHKKFTEAEYKADGWYDLIEPHYNDIIQRLGKVVEVLDNGGELLNYTYSLIDLTLSESEEKIKEKNLTDDSALLFSNREKNGSQVCFDFFTKIFREIKNNVIVRAKGISVLEFFYDSVTPLKDGLYELSIDRLTALNVSGTPKDYEREQKDEIIQKITQLITNEN